MAAKTGEKRGRIAHQGDTGSTAMGNWTPRHLRRTGGGGGGGGKATRRIVKPPVGGWLGGDPGKNGAK